MIREKLESLLNVLNSGDKIDLLKLSQKLEYRDHRIHMTNGRLGVLLREYKGTLLDYKNGRWFKK